MMALNDLTWVKQITLIKLQSYSKAFMDFEVILTDIVQKDETNNQ